MLLVSTEITVSLVIALVLIVKDVINHRTLLDSLVFVKVKKGSILNGKSNFCKTSN